MAGAAMRVKKIAQPSVPPFMNLLPPHSAIAATSRASAIALTVFLFVAGSFRAAGQAFPGVANP